MDKFQNWLAEEIKGIREDCKLIGRLDERVSHMEKRVESMEEKLCSAPKSVPPAPAEQKSLTKSAVINVSTAGLGGAVLWILQKVFGP